MAALAQQRADEKVMKLAEDQKVYYFAFKKVITYCFLLSFIRKKTNICGINFIQRQKEALHNRIIELEKKLDAKQALVLEIERLRGSLNVMRHMGDDGDLEVLVKVEAIHKELREKEGEYDDLDALNQALIIKERKCNDELQEARKEMISVSAIFLPIGLCHV